MSGPVSYEYLVFKTTKNMTTEELQSFMTQLALDGFRMQSILYIDKSEPFLIFEKHPGTR